MCWSSIRKKKINFILFCPLCTHLGPFLKGFLHYIYLFSTVFLLPTETVGVLKTEFSLATCSQAHIYLRILKTSCALFTLIHSGISNSRKIIYVQRLKKVTVTRQKKNNLTSCTEHKTKFFKCITRSHECCKTFQDLRNIFFFITELARMCQGIYHSLQRIL